MSGTLPQRSNRYQDAKNSIARGRSAYLIKDVIRLGFGRSPGVAVRAEQIVFIPSCRAPKSSRKRSFRFNKDRLLGTDLQFGQSGLGLDFRAEAFNIFNRVVFGNPQGNVNSNSFGQVTSQANTAPQMQGALKLYW